MHTSPSRNLQNILYIEDDEALAHLLQKRMARVGFQVDIALNGEEGLKLIRKNTYDLVLVDYQLPGMNGLDVLAALTPPADYPPVIVLTAGGDEKVALQALANGAADYAVKDVGQLYFDLLPAVMQAAFTKDRLTRENELQRRELAEAKEKAESASLAKSDFLATMSHEIRTPMNAVVGLSTLLARTPLNDKQREMVDTLRTNADVLLKLINNLLDLSRIEAEQIELEISDFTLGEVLKELEGVFDLQMKQKGLAFTVTDASKGLTLQGDRTRIQQIMINLVGNAFKFTDKGGIDAKVTATAGPDGRAEVAFSVTDTGIGIAPAKLATIFNKFSQADQSISRRFGGSGLGLAISKRLSQLMGGDIKVTSTEGKGSTFTATWNLPVARIAAPESVAATADTANAAPTHTTVLLVEDYPANVMVATMMLESMGYSVEAVPSGKQAIQKISAQAAPYVAILMDVQMNDMDGYETTRRVRALEKEKGFRHTIIGVTAHALAGDRERCIEAGMDDYMSKPIHPEVLAQKLSKLRPAA